MNKNRGASPGPSTGKSPGADEQERNGIKKGAREMARAKFKGIVKQDAWNRKAWEHTELVYEYRGHTYIITKHNNGYMGTSLKEQHNEEQKKIDYIIEHENDPIPDYKYEGSAQEGFDIFWEYVNAE